MAEKNRYVLREIEMEEAQHQTLPKLLSHIAARKGQLMLAMYLPSFPPTILPRLTCPAAEASRTTSPPIAPK